MVYQKQTWYDGKSGGTPISAARLNYLEQGLADARTVETFTTTQRNALTAAGLWDGRLIYNSTLDKIQRYDVETTSWVTIADSSEVEALLATTGTPAALGTAALGASTKAARADHVHPKDTQTIINTTNGITLATNISNSGDGVEAVRRNNVVTLRIYVASSTTTNTTFFTMPVGWRPPIAVRFNVDQNTNLGGSRSCLLSTTGVVTIEGGLAAGSIVFGSVTYIASDS